MIGRRDFFMLLGGVAAMWPLAARAQQAAMPVIGVLSSASPDLVPGRFQAFRAGLGETGYVEGRNVALDIRWSDHYDQLPGLAAELVGKKVSLIAALGNAVNALAAKAATSTIPIVFATGADPVQRGLVASLNRPGGNITGITQLAAAVITKRVQLLHDLLPNARVIGALVNPDNLVEATQKAEEDAARSLGMSIEIATARTEADIGAAIASFAEKRVDAIDVFPEALFSSRAEELAALAAKYVLPTMYPGSEFPRFGGLISYGSDVSDSYRQAGIYAGRILKGERPAELPVVQPIKFDLVINLKTAKALGLTVPPTLLAIADEVIE